MCIFTTGMYIVYNFLLHCGEIFKLRYILAVKIHSFGMETLCSLPPLPSEQREWKTDYGFCFICQKVSSNDILYHGKSFLKIINCLKDLVALGDDESQCIMKRVEVWMKMT